MRGLDPRLVRRARPVRSMLAADAALGLVAALLVIAQAVLIARVAAEAFGGASLGDVTVPLALLIVAVVGRAAGAWGFEVVGRRAATNVQSQLRNELVEKRLRSRPAALDGAESAELATIAVSGVDALETTFARYIPQVVLAAVVPVAVLAVVASIDLVSAGVMLLTLPLVPVFMWLVGRHTERRARERWHALSFLAGHFLDVVRGLPTLRAFNRGEPQVERISEVGDRYRRATMGTLRIAFLSGAVLELMATLGIALVAVTVGVRLVSGGMAFEAALTVLVLSPELYLPLRNLAAQFHAGADGLAVASRLLDLVEASEPLARGGGLAPSPRDGGRPARGSLLLLSGAAGKRAELPRPRAPAGRDRRACRVERSRKEHGRLPTPPLGATFFGARYRRRGGPRGMRPGDLAGSTSPGSRSTRLSSAAPWRKTSRSAIPPPARRASAPPRSSREPTSSSAGSPTVSGPLSATGGGRFPRVSGGGLRSPARFSAMRRS